MKNMKSPNSDLRANHHNHCDSVHCNNNKYTCMHECDSHKHMFTCTYLHTLYPGKTFCIWVSNKVNHSVTIIFYIALSRLIKTSCSLVLHLRIDAKNLPFLSNSLT